MEETPTSASGSAWADSVESAARVIDPGSANDIRLTTTKCRDQCPKAACTRSGRRFIALGLPSPVTASHPGEAK